MKGAFHINKLKDTKKFYNIDFLRIIFSLVIVYYHILHSNIISYTDSSAFYEQLAKGSNFAGGIVIYFFILSGFFLYKSYIKRPDMRVGEFVLRKVARLWGVLALSVFITAIFFKADFYTSFMNILFLQAVGVSSNSSGINWFVSPLFWALIFYFVLARCIKKEKIVNLITAVLSYFSFVIILNYADFKLSRDTAYGIFSLSALTAVGFIGFGWLIASSLNAFYSLDYVKNYKYTPVTRALAFIISSAAEILSAVILAFYMFWRDKAGDNILIGAIAFCILLVCFVAQKGLFSKLLNNKYIGFAGRYSYSVYIMQQIAFYILQKTLWTNTDFVVNHAYRTIAVSLAFSGALGVLVYYICEKPSSKLINSFANRLFSKNAAGKN
ncbi:MAG: acyltransferase [Clostridiales bacterium]|nr:acyltransferase [Clostridiales bacterium]